MLLALTVSSYDEVVKDYKVTYLAGGAAQNAARGAAVSNVSAIGLRVQYLIARIVRSS